MANSFIVWEIFVVSYFFLNKKIRDDVKENTLKTWGRIQKGKKNGLTCTIMIGFAYFKRV